MWSRMGWRARYSPEFARLLSTDRHANIQNTSRSMRYTTATRNAHTHHLFASPHAL